MDTLRQPEENGSRRRFETTARLHPGLLLILDEESPENRVATPRVWAWGLQLMAGFGFRVQESHRFSQTSML